MRKKFTEEQLDFIRESYKQMKIADIVEVFNERFNESKTCSQIRAATRNHKMRSGRTGYFTKGIQNCPAHVVKKANSGSFKKGNKPHNWRPVGSTRITVDGYTEIKTEEPRKWKLLHRVVWEKENGNVPRGHAVIFKDGDKQNCDISNLELVTKGEVAVFNKNGYGDAPQEAKETVRTISRIKIKVRELQGNRLTDKDS